MSDVFEFLVVMFPLTCSLCLVNSILTASVTKTVDKSESGAMLGLNMAVHSIIRSDYDDICSLNYVIDLGKGTLSTGINAFLP